jgi:glycosyltransferase involved in cell wall biosynthesis
MKVVHVIEPFASGINTFVHEIVMGNPQFEHTIVYGKRNGLQNIDSILKSYDDRVRFIPWKYAQREVSFIKDLKALITLIKILKSVKIDVLHLHSSKAGVLGRIAACFIGQKIVVYTPNAVAFLRTDISAIKKRVFRCIERLTALLSGVIISSSRSEFQALYELGISSKIINNGVTTVVDKVNTTPNIFLISMVGNITIQKNPELFNKIASAFIGQKNIEFLWVGDGEMKNVLTSSNIEVTGWLDKHEVLKKLSKSYFYLSTSSWEGLSLAGIEAMSFGLPMLVKKCVGNVNLVQDGFNGFVFNELNEAVSYISKLIQDKELYNTLAIGAKERYELKYKGELVAANYRKLYLHEQSKLGKN